ncbi:nucleotidyl transferase AbiEii/AbiGii toxin family protein [Sorangium sp. So ce426]|uniref:nucleotidyl transferase AbiEii/AbiGii toxin family protein n=1 Tax=unclassified Sorangium TaxID=2621164 RepID=UPI003F5C85E5
MAERDEHRRILDLLTSLDAALLRQSECWFAGGTAISLRCDEFRISRDVDFLCASREGYRQLRQRVYGRPRRGPSSRRGSNGNDDTPERPRRLACSSVATALLSAGRGGAGPGASCRSP